MVKATRSERLMWRVLEHFQLDTWDYNWPDGVGVKTMKTALLLGWVEEGADRSSGAAVFRLTPKGNEALRIVYEANPKMKRFNPVV